MHTSPLAGNFLEVLYIFLPKVFYAVVCGGIIGLERELKNKSAGIKTNILICLGSALFASASSIFGYIPTGGTGAFQGDPSRVAAQIVSGIGFLGGGAIIQSRGTVVGLTTAATIWVVAAIGIFIGLGSPELALVTSIAVVAILVAITEFEARVLHRVAHYNLEVVAVDKDDHFRSRVQDALSSNDLLLLDFECRVKDGRSSLSVRYSGQNADHRNFILQLWNMPGVEEVRQS